MFFSFHLALADKTKNKEVLAGTSIHINRSTAVESPFHKRWKGLATICGKLVPPIVERLILLYLQVNWSRRKD